jgi:hypothetical protein
VDAARYAARHRLRAFDAVQLACAVAARDADPSVESVAVFAHERYVDTYGHGDSHKSMHRGSL